MKKIIIFIGFLAFTSCQAQKTMHSVNIADYAQTITASDLKEALYIYASDDFEGRKTGEPGQKKAVEFIKNKYIGFGIKSPLANGDYFQHIPESFFRNGIKASENVVAFIKGIEKPDEVVIISAHLDHKGISKDGQIYNGADDDGSGTVAVLGIAKAFQAAVKSGHRPKRSILFLHVTGEELGLYGSRYYTDVDPIFPLANTVVDLNIDMIGRIDPKHADNHNYLYLIGADKLSTELHTISEDVNKKYFNMDFDYTYNDDNDPNRFYYRSDHYNFAKNNIPVIFYFNGTHADYHRPTDTPDKIDYDLLETRTKLIFYTAWELANRDNRIVVDKIKS
ncbi:M28 family metallopeptidase [Yeosuana sp.]|uniref:M28 family metallopeptidase n=1 Tax=Yeosuana sp. TaxID=2529388 RepID=UPI004054B147|tara:strand:+ start:1467 stop:2474 length:1008 start_codon:yes stop_codon:yes gene_type:complete